MFTVECFFSPDGITPNSSLTGPNNTYIYIYIYIYMIRISGQVDKWNTTGLVIIFCS